MLREMEVDGVGYVSPYAKAAFVMSLGGDGKVDTEEVNMDFFNVAPSLDIRIGKVLVDTDTLNPLHQHAIPFVEKPLMLQHAFGDDPFKVVGINTSYLIPNPWDHYLILSLTYGANAYNVTADSQYTALYGGTNQTPIYTARLGTTFDLASNTYLNVNATEILTPLPDGSNSAIYIGDFLLRFAPSPNSNNITFLNGYLWNRGNPSGFGAATNTGFYNYLGWQFSPRWKIGARYDQTVNSTFQGFEQQVAGILSFYPTETNYLRLQLARHQLATGLIENRFWVQIDFSIGPHQPHTAL